MGYECAGVATDLVPCVLLVEDNWEFGSQIAEWMFDHEINTVFKKSLHDGVITLRDAIFSNAVFDGLLASFSSEEPCYHLLTEFRHEFPNKPVAVMIQHEDRRLTKWANERGVLLFKKPFDLDQLDSWAPQLKPTRPSRRNAMVTTLSSLNGERA